MKKIELIYRELLYQHGEQQQSSFTQLQLAKQLQLSLSTVHHALLPLRRMGAVEMRLKSFHILDPQKILYHWASLRNLQNDIIYQVRVEQPVRKIEAEMPPTIVFAAYSAYKLRFRDVPADYSEVYVYGSIEDGSVEEVKARFPPARGNPNLFILAKDQFIEKYGKATTLAHTFVDLWNLPEWYAKEFVLALQQKMGKKMGGS